MPGFFIYNGQLHVAGDKVIGPPSRALRYGDGLFETMKVENGQIALGDYHFDRLFRGLALLKFKWPASFNQQLLSEQIHLCIKKNKAESLARIRLNVFRGEGGLYDLGEVSPHFIIESWPLDPPYTQLNAGGWEIDIFPDARKSCDSFSNIKHNNFQPYVMAALFAKEHQLNDALVLNQYGRIADSTIANVFAIKENTVITNPLDEACIEGVMRRHILESLEAANIPVEQRPITTEDLLSVDEIFLTNAVAGMRWVRKFRSREYGNSMTKEFFSRFMK